jgi:glycosyltransferase involved in cell wall biosynthesis
LIRGRPAFAGDAAVVSGVPCALPGLLRALVLFHEPELLGAGRSTLQAVEALEEYGWSVSGWVPGDGPLLDNARERLAAVGWHDRPIAFSARGWREDPGVLVRLRGMPGYIHALRSTLLRTRPHIVHANTLLSLPEACVARSLGLPVVLHVHELPPPTLKRRAALTLATTMPDVVVGVSDAVSEMLREHSSRAPVLTVHNGVRVSERLEARRGGGAFTVGTISTVSRLKGTDVFLRAATIALRSRPELRFEHVGQTELHKDPGLDQELAGLLASGKAGGDVNLLGRRPAEDVLPTWDLFVLPSRMEAFPLATLEAMAAGVPIVASGVGGIPEQLVHLESGVLVPPDDPAALAEWIVRLHDDAELRRRLAAGAAQRARSLFTIERQAQGLHRAYLIALNRRFGPPPARRAAREAA